MATAVKRTRPYKDVLGFENGYVTLFQGDTFPFIDWFRASIARYLRMVHMIWVGGCCGGVLLRHWLGEGGDLLALRAVHSPFQGIWPPAFPTPPGDFARTACCAFPTPLPRGPLQQLKKAKSACSTLYFFVPRLPLCKQACNGQPGTKKASKRCLKAFFTVAVRGGFEPPVRLPVRQFSKLVVSATHPSHLSAQWVICLHKRFGTAKIC